MRYRVCEFVDRSYSTLVKKTSKDRVRRGIVGEIKGQEEDPGLCEREDKTLGICSLFQSILSDF